MSMAYIAHKNSYDAELGGLCHLHWDKTICLEVPATGRSRMDARAIILLNYAGHHVFELFVKLCQLLY